MLGTLNLLTDDRIRQAAALVKTGKAFSLALEMHLPDPPLYGRQRTEHTVLPSQTGTSFNDRLAFNTQASTQWDGFRHMRHPDHGFYSGLPAERHGIHHWARRGIVGRAVLADVARWRESVGRPIEPGGADPIDPEDVEACLRAQSVELTAGDILLMRTGWTAWYRALDADERARYVAEGFASCGLRPGPSTLAFLWDTHVAAIAGDNPCTIDLWPPGALLEPELAKAMRADPARGPELWNHPSAIALLGLVVGELFDLDALAEHCAREKMYEAFFVSAPMPVVGGVASPATPLAIM